MHGSFKILATIAFVAGAIGGATTASAAVVHVKLPPQLSIKAAAPKIALPKICKNEISRTFVGPDGISYTAKKCR